MIDTPDPQNIFNSEYNYWNRVEPSEKFCIGLMNGSHGFEDNSKYIQDDKDNDETIEEFIPFSRTDFGMKKGMNFLSGFMIHFLQLVWYS